MRSNNSYQPGNRQRLGLDSKAGILGGVCAGIARAIEVDVSWVRVAAIISALFFTKIAVAAYLVAWLVLDRHR
jgi:phage shock protein PspC (stress-responsive transcriptional regulator)